MLPAVEAMRAAGAQHFVFLSLLGAQNIPVVPHRAVEDYLVQVSGGNEPVSLEGIPDSKSGSNSQALELVHSFTSLASAAGEKAGVSDKSPQTATPTDSNPVASKHEGGPAPTYTMLRPSFFMQNLLGPHVERELIRSDPVRSAVAFTRLDASQSHGRRSSLDLQF